MIRDWEGQIFYVMLADLVSSIKLEENISEIDASFLQNC